MEDMSLEEIREQGRLLQEQKEKLLKEKQAIEETSIMRRYFEIASEISSIDSDIKKNLAEETKLRYSLCNHDLLFLEVYCAKRKAYHPKFKCLECGKRITGAVERRQIVVNENYTTFDERAYIGDLKDYNKLSRLYSEYKEQGLETMQIAVLLEGYLHEKYHETKSVLKLVRK